MAKSKNQLILNRMEVCKGQFTWRRGQMASVVDFVLADSLLAGEVRWW